MDIGSCIEIEENIINNVLDVNSQIVLQSKLCHPSIVKFHTSFKEGTCVYLVFEQHEGIKLNEFIRYNGPVTENDACILIKEIINAVEYLYSQDVFHTDLCLKSILLTDDMDIKIHSFGFLKKLEYPAEKKCTMLETANFMSPEEVKTEPYDSKDDCWRVGCILYALLYDTPPFDDKGKIYTELMNAAVMSRLTFPDYASKEAKDLLSHMLEKDPNKRINIHKALHYPFFQKHNTLCNTKSESSEGSVDTTASSSSTSEVITFSTDWKKKIRTIRTCLQPLYTEYEEDDKSGADARGSRDFAVPMSVNLSKKRLATEDHALSSIKKANFNSENSTLNVNHQKESSKDMPSTSANIEHPSRPRKLRPIIIDGSNVARAHGQVTDTFSCQGIEIAVKYFEERGHKEIIALVPQFRQHASKREKYPTTSPSILNQLFKKKYVYFIPSRKVRDKKISTYDDRVILHVAARLGGVVVSNDQFNDLIDENESFTKVIEERL